MKRWCAALALVALGCASSADRPQTTLADVVRILHPLDLTAPYGFRQWPTSYDKRYGNFGVSMMIWPDHAVLVMDAKPLAVQFATLPQGLTPAAAARRLKVNRWHFTAKQCPAIPEMFAALEVLPAVPAEPPPAQEQPIHGYRNHAELAITRDGTSARYETFLAWPAHAAVLQQAWVALDACARSHPPRNR
jgi:hypothetical protein